MMYITPVRWLAPLVGLAASAAFAQPVLITGPQTINPGQTTITPTSGGPPVPLATADITVQRTTLTMNGRHEIASLTLTGASQSYPGRVTHSDAFAYDADPGPELLLRFGMHLVVSGDVTILDYGEIAAGAGYPASQGPGAGVSGGVNDVSGGGYGGSTSSRFGPTFGTTYGSYLEPIDMGSGSGLITDNGQPYGAAGGGVIRLEVGGTLNISGTGLNGRGFISAHGRGTEVASGSGGSAWITCDTITGNGFISAGGGGGFSGGGGGGRIALYASSSMFDGIITAGGRANGGPGSVYKVIGSQTPELSFSGRASTRFAENGLTLDGNLVINNQAVLAPRDFGETFLLDVSGNVTITDRAGIDGSSRGYDAGQGPGAGDNGNAETPSGAGGGYGGSGQNASPDVQGGSTYGSAIEPRASGSGSGLNATSGLGSPGGGALDLRIGGRLSVDATSFVRSNGAVRASSGPLTGTGGSGGSVLIAAGEITGAGTIAANGGTAKINGGGGRVALYACTNTFTGAKQALAGGPGAGGGSVVAATAGAEVEPVPGSFCTGDTVTLNSNSGGFGTLEYQWFRNGVQITDGLTLSNAEFSGATTDTLTIDRVTFFETGDYTVEVTAACGSDISDPVSVSVCRADVDCDQDSDSDDINAYFASFESSDSTADLDGDGDVDSDDIIAFFAGFEQGC